MTTLRCLILCCIIAAVLGLDTSKLAQDLAVQNITTVFPGDVAYDNATEAC